LVGRDGCAAGAGVAAVSGLAAMSGLAAVIAVAAGATVDVVPGLVKPPFLQIFALVLQV